MIFIKIVSVKMQNVYKFDFHDIPYQLWILNW